MPKHTFDDMVRIKREHSKKDVTPSGAPKTRRSIEDNPLLNRPRIRREESADTPRPENTFVSKNLNQKAPRRRETMYHGGFDEETYDSSSNGKHGMWFAAIIAIIFLLFGVTLLFGQAKITIQPKIENINLDENMTAERGTGTEALEFDLVFISGEETDTLLGKTEENVSLKARGTVLLYNSFSSAPQTLDIDTRLEGSNGKMYKTDKRVIVPGMKDGVPGSVEVGIYANEAGEAYNSTPLDFKIFGFKNGPKYEKFYGRSKGGLEGGFVGKMTTVSEEEKNAAITRLRASLKTKLLQKVVGQIPPGFILFDNAVKLVIEQETVEKTGEEGKVPVTVKGSLYGFLFEETELTKSIVSKSVKDYDEKEDVYIPNIKNFVFTLTTPDISFKDIKTIAFNLKGSGDVVSRIDADQVRSDTLGAKKKEFQTILTSYENIDTASVVIRPFWKSSFPEKMNKIKVDVEYPS
jgi:hypothetical protein